MLHLLNKAVGGLNYHLHRVTLNGPAPVGGAVVNLTSANPSLIGVPATVTVPAGAVRATFNATTQEVVANTNVVVTASYLGEDRAATVTLLPMPQNIGSLPPGVSVHVGYADYLHHDKSGLGPNTPLYLNDNNPTHMMIPGNDYDIDSSVLRIDNNSGGPLTVDKIYFVMNGGAGPTFDLWSSFTIPNGSLATVLQTKASAWNFDGSEFGMPLGSCNNFCGTALNPCPHTPPLIKMRVNGQPNEITLVDTAHLLTTGGIDLLVCPATVGGGESLQWRAIGTTGAWDRDGNGSAP